MVLSEFTYREASGWHVERLKLNLQNLIVGLNSVGKSRTISAIGHVASFIKGEVDAQGDFSCSLLLEENLVYARTCITHAMKADNMILKL